MLAATIPVSAARARRAEQYRRHVNVFVDGETSASRMRRNPVTNDSEVRIYPAISGG